MGQLVNARQKNNYGQVIELSPAPCLQLVACSFSRLPSHVSRSLPFPTWGLFSAEISTSETKGNSCTYIRAWFAGWLISGTVLDFLTIAWELSGTRVMQGQSMAPEVTKRMGVLQEKNSERSDEQSTPGEERA